MCAVMEENKQNLEFITPEVKVIAVASQGVLCQSQTEPEDEAPIRADALQSYKKIYF